MRPGGAELSLMMDVVEESLPLAVLRPSQIYGAGPRFRAHHPFLHAMLDKAKKGDDILLYGNHDPWRNFIYIECRNFADLYAAFAWHNV